MNTIRDIIKKLVPCFSLCWCGCDVAKSKFRNNILKFIKLPIIRILKKLPKLTGLK